MDILTDTGGAPADFEQDAQVFERPAKSMIYAEEIPQAMRSRDQWVLWKWSLRKDSKGLVVLCKETGEPKWTKPPCQPNGWPAKTTDPKTWSAFDEVMTAFNASGSTFDGIGYVFSAGDGLVGIDLDEIFLTDSDGKLRYAGGGRESLAIEIYDRFKDHAYIELSPSHDGCHMIVTGEWFAEWNKAPGNTWIETYDHKSPRYFTVTGNTLGGSTENPEPYQEGLHWLAERFGKKGDVTDKGEIQTNALEHDDAFLIGQIRVSANADLFTKGIQVDKKTGEIIEDHSSLDLSLCKALAFWTGRRAGQMDRLFRLSALMRDKWDEMRGRQTYGDMTIRKAIEYAENNGEAVYGGKGRKGTPTQEGALVSGEISQQKMAVTLTKIMRALKDPSMCGRTIAHDRYLGANVYHLVGQTEWHLLKDPDQVLIRAHLENKYFSPIPKELMRDSIMAVCAEHEVDSGILWTETLPAWDGISRVSGFLRDYWGAEDTNYTASVSEYIWTALGGRLLVPGIKADMVPIMVGAQGIRKSTGLLTMCPTPERFLEVNLTAKSDDLARKMRGRMIGELAELAGKSKKEVEEVRAFITSRTETWRRMYGEDTITYPRRIFFIGTSNDNAVLTDPDGLRRWLPVEVTMVDTTAIERDRDQLWAEGIAMFQKQGILWQDAQALATNVHEAFVEELPWAARIDSWLESDCFLPGATGTWRQQPILKINDVMEHGLQMPTKDINRPKTIQTADALKRLGYKRDSIYDPITKKSSRGWVIR